MSNDNPVEQAIRRSHCAHAEREDPRHRCIGTCLTLSCKACGDDDRPIAPSDTLPETRLVRSVLDALGISYEALSPEYKARAAEVAKRWIDAPGPQPDAYEPSAILGWISDALAGKPVGDFAASFPLVRAVQDLYMERDVLRRLDRENLELRKRLTVWCDAIINDQLCTKAAQHRVVAGGREVWVCAVHHKEALVWQAQFGDDAPVDPQALPFQQAPGSLAEWPGPEPRSLPQHNPNPT